MSNARADFARRDLRAQFEQLVLPLLPMLHRIARRLACPPHEPADLVQETCLRAYRTFGNFEPGTNPKAWLLAILYSIAANAFAKGRGNPEIQVDDVDARFTAVVTGQRDEELTLLRQFDTSPHIQAALDQMPGPFRDAVLLVDVEELTYEAAASVVGCPVGTLRSRLFRGRKYLFLALQDYARQVRVLRER